MVNSFYMLFFSSLRHRKKRTKYDQPCLEARVEGKRGEEGGVEGRGDGGKKDTKPEMLGVT